MQPVIATTAQALDRARGLAQSATRTLIGITGAPGAGKSTLAQAVVDHVGESARVVSMDGFHLSQRRLRELGRLQRKGAIDTFDAAGFVALVQRLSQPGGETVYAPEFRRDLEEPIAGSIAVEPEVRLVVLEGNYLLASYHPWSSLSTVLKEVWYCERDEDQRLRDLITRHETFGKSSADARAWALGSDQRNAELIRTTRDQADLVIAL